MGTTRGGTQLGSAWGAIGRDASGIVRGVGIANAAFGGMQSNLTRAFGAMSKGFGGHFRRSGIDKDHIRIHATISAAESRLKDLVLLKLQKKTVC